MPVKVLLIDAYSAAHVGNAALLKCSLEVLLEAFPGSTFEVLAKDPESLKALCGCECHSYLFPDLLSPEKRSGLRALWWAIKNVAWAAVDALNLGLGLGLSPLAYSFDARRREAVRALLDADLVVAIGGEMLNWRFRRVTPFLLHGYWAAKRLGKRVVLFPQSIGPLGKGWFMRLTRLALRDCDLILARDLPSLDEVARLGLPARQTLLVPDVAVSQRQASREQAIELLRAEGWRGPGEGPVLGLAVCAEGREAFPGLRGLCEYVVSERCGQVVFLSANHPEDLVASGELFDSLSDAARARSVLLSKCHRPGEFKAITGILDVFVSMRMHAAILATMAPVPTIAINTQPKVRGYMELAGQGERCLELAEANEVRLRGVFENCLAHNEALRQGLMAAREELEPRVRTTGASVRALFGVPTEGALFDTVVSGGYCVGCGACAYAAGDGIRMNLDALGRLQAVKNCDDGKRDPARVCPFSAEALDEDALAEEFLGATPKRCGEMGRYRSLHAAHVRDAEARARGSSGGVTTWVLSRLLESGEVDGVVHVRPREATAEDKRLFAYAVSRSVEEVREGAKSHYYPVEMSEVLRTVAETPGRYAVVGLPCFIKAVRLLMRQDAVLAERISCCIGLVCGGLKSAAFAECLAWQCGIEPGALRNVDFRVKLAGHRAEDYGFEANGAVAPMRGLLGADWGLNFFSYGACDYCDDVFAETADLSIGDAWLRRYAKDGLGTNLLVVRSEGMERLIREGMRAGELATTALTEKDAVRSQRGGLFNRRAALAWRLYRVERAGRWYPPKRVRSNARALGRRERRKHLLRSLLGAKSGMAFRRAVDAGDLEELQREMAPWVARYRAVARPWWMR